MSYISMDINSYFPVVSKATQHLVAHDSGSKNLLVYFCGRETSMWVYCYFN